MFSCLVDYISNYLHFKIPETNNIYHAKQLITHFNTHNNIGVSSVSSGSSVNSANRSLRSFNYDSLSNFQNVCLNPHTSRITRTTVSINDSENKLETCIYISCFMNEKVSFMVHNLSNL